MMKISTAFLWFLRLPGNNHGKPIGYLTGQNARKSKAFCQENLTEFARKVENRADITPYSMALGKIGTGLSAIALAATVSGGPKEAAAEDISPVVLAAAGQTVMTVEECKQARRDGDLDRNGYQACKLEAMRAQNTATEGRIAEQQRVLEDLREQLAAYGLQLNSRAQILDQGGQVLAQIVAINGKLILRAEAEERIRAADARSAAAIESAKAFLDANS